MEEFLAVYRAFSANPDFRLGIRVNLTWQQLAEEDKNSALELLIKEGEIPEEVSFAIRHLGARVTGFEENKGDSWPGKISFTFKEGEWKI